MNVIPVRIPTQTQARVVYRMPMEDPFDHSHCAHPRPHWPLDISDELKIDLIHWLHHLWKLAVNQELPRIVAMIEELNEYLALSALGERDEIDKELRGRKAFENDVAVLHDDTRFNDELKRLLESIDGESGGDSADDDKPGEDD